VIEKTCVPQPGRLHAAAVVAAANQLTEILTKPEASP